MSSASCHYVATGYDGTDSTQSTVQSAEFCIHEIEYELKPICSCAIKCISFEGLVICNLLCAVDLLKLVVCFMAVL